jgi:hypothetical protein
MFYIFTDDIRLAAFMCIFNGPLGFITAIPLILGEAAALTTIIAKTFYLGPALEDLFDDVRIISTLHNLC